MEHLAHQSLWESRFPLEAGVGHVWYGSHDRIGRGLANHEELLSTGELIRARAIRNDVQKQIYVKSRVMLRDVLARYVEGEPKTIEIDVEINGKPKVAWKFGLEFNMSHVRGLTAIVVAKGQGVGIDIECARQSNLRLQALLPHLAYEERRQLRGLPELAMTRGLLRCWVRKEAYVKGLGSGLSLPFDSFAVDVWANRPIALQNNLISGASDTWWIQPLETNGMYVGALASEKAALKLQYRDWVP